MRVEIYTVPLPHITQFVSLIKEGCSYWTHQPLTDARPYVTENERDRKTGAQTEKYTEEGGEKQRLIQTERQANRQREAN